MHAASACMPKNVLLSLLILVLLRCFKDLILKRISLLLLLLTYTSSCFANSINIIPQPNSVTFQTGEYQFCAATTVVAAPELEQEARYLRETLQLGAAELAETCTIQLKLSPKKMAAEAYQLNVSKTGVEIVASSGGGVFYAIQSLRQMLPVLASDLSGHSLPWLTIDDAPRFKWRGVMLDDSRQFWGVDFVKTFIDRLALYKFNTFQWHLSDDDGWRIEIKKYPKLTEQGAFRGPDELLPGRYGHELERHGGFYTQAQIKHIVAYAAARHITIVPEIDVPAHSRVVMDTYPELVSDPLDQSEYQSVQHVAGNTLNPAMHGTYQFLADVFAEVAELFPGAYIHVGGDERPEGAWVKSPAVKQLMLEQGLTELDQVQSYFFKRLEGIVQSHGRRMIGWEEMAHGGDLAASTTYMAWSNVQAGINTAENSQYTVMAPAPYTYIDMAQTKAADEPGYRWAGVLDTKRIYSFDPVPAELSADKQPFILGVQSCLWGETLADKNTAEFMMFPRLLGVAEIAWTQPRNKSWPDFGRRLMLEHLPRLKAMGVAYRVPVVAIKPKQPLWAIDSPYAELEVRYTTDGSRPSRQSTLYTGAFDSKGSVVKARAYDSNGRASRIIEGYSNVHLGQWDIAKSSTTQQAFSVDLSPFINASAGYLLQFSFLENQDQSNEHQTGEAQAAIENLTVLRNGQEFLALTPLHYAAWENTQRINLYNFPIRQWSSQDYYELKFELKADGAKPKQLKLELFQQALLMPEASVSSSFEDSESSNLRRVIDSDSFSLFESSQPGRLGDHITVSLDSPKIVSGLNWRTGGLDRDGYVVNATVEVSSDGENFTAVGQLQDGRIEKSFEQPRPIAKVRMRLLEPQSSRPVVGDLQLLLAR